MASENVDLVACHVQAGVAKASFLCLPKVSDFPISRYAMESFQRNGAVSVPA